MKHSSYGPSRNVMAGIVIAALSLTPTALAQEQRWITQFGTHLWDSAEALAPDGAGGVIVAGGMQTGPGWPSPMVFDAYIARYDDAGNRVWLHQIGTNLNDIARALATDGAGGTFIAGGTEGALGGPNAGLLDVFLARYDETGNQIWIHQFGTNGFDGVGALLCDGAGGVIVVGNTQGSLGGPNAGSFDAFLARFDGVGNQLWLRQFGSIWDDWLTGLAADGAGGFFVCGATKGDAGGIPNFGDSDILLARYDKAGNRLWIRQFGTNAYDTASALAPDGAGGVVVTGFTAGRLGSTSAGANDVFLARYDSAGNRLWLKQFGTSGGEVADALAPSGTGGTIVAGSTSDRLGGPNAGGSDIFLARHDNAGNRLWIRQFGTSELDWARALAPDGAGGVMVAGLTFGNLGEPGAGGAGAFVARYTIDSCYPDCDHSTGNGVLDIFDFLCWQNDFVIGNSYACDCDTTTGPLVCDLFDFLCFQDAFVNGCP